MVDNGQRNSSVERGLKKKKLPYMYQVQINHDDFHRFLNLVQLDTFTPF